MHKLSFEKKKCLFLQATSLDVSNTTKDVVETMIDNSSVCSQNLMLMIELRKKILTFRDIIDLPPCECSSSIYEVFNSLHEQYAITRKVIYLKLHFISFILFLSSGSC